MIPQNELRFGNLVLDTNTGREVSVTDLVIAYSHLYNPILLTEKLLEEFGFESCDDDGSYIHKWNNGIKLFNDYLANYSNGDNFYWMEFRRKSIDVTIKSLHQLENIFFALTGDELNLYKNKINEC